MINENKNLNSLDLAKFIMAIEVIAIHTSPLYNFQGTIFFNLFDLIIRTSVPLFFMATSYLLFSKYYNNNCDLDYLKKYIKKIIKLYVLWSVIYLPISIYGYHLKGTSIINSMTSYIHDFFIKGEHYYSWPLWFLLSSIYSITFIYVFTKIKRKNGKLTKNYEIILFIISMIFFIIGNYFSSLVSNIDNLSGIFKKIAILIKSCIFNGRLMTGFMYITIGMLLSKYKVNIKKIYIVLGIFSSLLLSFYYNCLIFKVTLYILSFIFILSIDLKFEFRFFTKNLYKVIIFFEISVIF